MSDGIFGLIPEPQVPEEAQDDVDESHETHALVEDAAQPHKAARSAHVVLQRHHHTDSLYGEDHDADADR